MTDGSCQNKKAEPHYVYRNRIRRNSATPTSLLSKLWKFGSRRYDWIFNLGLSAAVWQLRSAKRSWFQNLTSDSEAAINSALPSASSVGGSLTSRLIKPTPDNVFYKGQSNYHTRETLARLLRGGPRFLCALGGHRGPQCMSEQLKIKSNILTNILHSWQINKYLQRDLAECRKYSIIHVTTFWLQFY